MKEEKFWMNSKREIVDPESPDAVILVIQVFDDKGEIIEEKTMMTEDYLKSLKKVKPKE